MITKSAKNKRNFLKKAYFTNSAREGWELILRTLEPSSKILLPSYIGITDREGSGIYDPVINVGIEHDFYLLNDDLTISLSEIEKNIKNEDYNLILLVHYFGFKINNIDEIVKLCKKHNIIVVEDCAHLYNYNLINFTDVGTFGDFTFYSLHKFFPFENGGMLIQNNSTAFPLNYSEIKLTHQLSSELIKYDVKAIADKRRKNFNTLNKLIGNISGIRSLKIMRDGDIPHNYPIIVENGLREKLYFWLMGKNVPLIALYYRLINPLQKEKYLTMQNISNEILNLPIHQDITTEDIIYFVDLIKEGLLELK